MRLEALEARRAIESLRAGVPSRAVVEQVGNTHTEIQDAFRAALDNLREAKGTEPIGCMALFGQGKTHLLIHLRTLAERAGFATSLVVVSPETPLGNPAAVLSELCRNASVDGRIGDALRELQSSARTDSHEWAEFRLWARDAGIVQRFQALIFLYEEMHTDVDFRVRILEDVQGKPMPLTEIRSALRELGQTSAYNLRGTPRAKALVPERIRLLARWFRAFGRQGLVVFFDEMERLERFTAKQRMAAYEQLAWWTETARQDGAALLPVWFTADELDEVRPSDGKNIRDEVLGAVPLDVGRINPNEVLGASPRWRGWEVLGRYASLGAPSPDQLRDLQFRVATLYMRAYGMDRVADLQVQPQPHSVRQEIRRWIAYWDMQRLYPGYTPDIAVGEVEMPAGEEWGEDVTTEDEAE